MHYPTDPNDKCDDSLNYCLPHRIFLMPQFIRFRFIYFCACVYVGGISTSEGSTNFNLVRAFLQQFTSHVNNKKEEENIRYALDCEHLFSVLQEKNEIRVTLI